MNVKQLADMLRQDPKFMENVTRWEVIPPRPARTADFPASDAVNKLPKRFFSLSNKSLQFPVLTLIGINYMISTNIFLYRMKDVRSKIAKSTEKGFYLWANISEPTAFAARPAPS